MYSILKIATLIAGIWAAMHPAVYGVLFLFFVDYSAIIDLMVVASCIIIVWHTFRSLPLFLWIVSLAVLFLAASIGFFHHFRDVGESGPLPYEWLNGYYKFSLPLIILALLNRLFQWRFDSSKADLQLNKHAGRRQ